MSSLVYRRRFEYGGGWADHHADGTVVHYDRDGKKIDSYSIEETSGMSSAEVSEHMRRAGRISRHVNGTAVTLFF